MKIKRIIAVAAVAIIPTFAACDSSLTAPELELEEPVIYSGPSAFLGRSRLPQEQEPGISRLPQEQEPSGISRLPQEQEPGISPKRRNRGANHGGRLGG